MLWAFCKHLRICLYQGMDYLLQNHSRPVSLLITAKMKALNPNWVHFLKIYFSIWIPKYVGRSQRRSPPGRDAPSKARSFRRRSRNPAQSPDRSDRHIRSAIRPSEDVPWICSHAPTMWRLLCCYKEKTRRNPVFPILCPSCGYAICVSLSQAFHNSGLNTIFSEYNGSTIFM